VPPRGRPPLHLRGHFRAAFPNTPLETIARLLKVITTLIFSRNQIDTRRSFSDVTQAILFDFDGLILDTETPIFSAWQQIYAEFACSLTVADYASCLGSSYHAFNPFHDLQRKSGQVIVEAEIQARLSDIYNALIAQNDALPGIRELLAAAPRLGIRTAVASSSTRNWIETHLTRLGLLSSFEIIRTRDDVERVKPEPDLFLAALEGLGLEADQAIVLEDSPNGILAARRAGIFAVAVPGPLTCDLPLNDPDLRLASLGNLPLPLLLELIQEQKQKRQTL